MSHSNLLESTIQLPSCTLSQFRIGQRHHSSFKDRFDNKAPPSQHLHLYRDKAVKQQTVREKIQRNQSFANREPTRQVYTNPGANNIEINQYELTEAIDLRSICGRFLRQTRMNTDRFKQLSNQTKVRFDRSPKTGQREQVHQRHVTPLFDCGSTSELCNQKITQYPTNRRQTSS